MAGADTSKVRLELEEVVVPENLVNGNKFLKWDEDSSNAIPVTLKVDPHGHYLHWKFQNKDVDCLELTQLTDTRTGKYANTPKDAKLRDLCDMGAKDVALEDKTITVVFGSDMVNISFINFCATSDKVAQEWCESLLKLAYQHSAHNPSPAKLLEKMHTKLTIMVNRDGHIPVRNIRKMFSSSNSDKKKLETALQVAGVHSGKDDTIDPKKFTFDVFFTFYLRLVNQKEVDRVFQEMGAKAKPYLTTDQLVKFLNNQQRDPRLNEILYPFYDAKQAMNIIERFEKNKQFLRKGHMSIDGLIKYLLSDDNQVDGMESYLIAQDMEQPLSHYFIKSSHNTYLTGHQLTGRSTVEIYRQVLLSGCRCVELDCWDGKENTDPEPIITHGYTMCTEVLFKDVIEAINESAFKTSDFPLVLSFENHCNQKQQAKMAHYCRTIFGDKLLIDPLSEFPIESGKQLPHPSAMKNKILVKNKKRKHTDANKKRSGKKIPKDSPASLSSLLANELKTEGRRLQSSTSLTSMDSGENSNENRPNRGGKGVKTIEETAESPEQNGEGESTKESFAPTNSETKSKSSKTEVNGDDPQSKLQKRKLMRQDAQDEEKRPPREKRKLSSQDSQEKPPSEAGASGENGDMADVSKLADGLDDVDEESDDSDDEEAMSKEEALKKMQEKKDRGTAGQEAEAGAEMSALVNYVQPVHFSSFEASEKKNHSYEISSFVETSAMNRVKENPVEFVNYNKRQLSRIYPKGTRVDSSNFMPQIFWNVGCQLVALNYQQLDLPMQLNLGFFNQNGRTGFILKPDFMRRKDRHFDPFAESTMDGIVAATVEIKLISGQFLSDKRVGTYVEVDMFGLPADTVRKKHKTKTVTGNGINPQYDEEYFVFQKLIMPQLAMLRITAYEDNNKQIGHRILPVGTLRPGYRHIPLRNELYQPLLMPSVFVHIKVSDYVPKGLATFADALVNPIQHQNQLDEQIRKRTEALSILMEDTKPTAVDEMSPVDRKDSDTSAGKANGKDEPKENSAAAAESDPVMNHPFVENKLVADAKEEAERRDSIEELPAGSGKTPRPSRQSEEIWAATIDEIKEERKYIKVKTRLDGDLQKKVKRHEKRQSKLKRKLDKEVAKLKDLHAKAKRSLEKKNQNALKKSQKSKQSKQEEVKLHCAKAMEKLDLDQEKELLRKLVSHEDQLIEMYKKHLFDEKEMRKEHAEMLFELQMELMTSIHEKQLKKLDSQHKKVEQDLRKMLESKNIDEMKSISKIKREKQELSRLKREFRKKHIDQAVNERSRLNQMQKKRKDELKATIKELQQKLSTEEFDMIYVIEDEYTENCNRLIRERKFQRLVSDSNGSIAAVGEGIIEAAHDVEQNGHDVKNIKKSLSSGLNGLSDGLGSGDEAQTGRSPTAGLTGVNDNGTTSTQGLITKLNGSDGVAFGSGLVAGEVEVHASVNGIEESNVNNSAQTEAPSPVRNQPNGGVHSGPDNSADMCTDLETGESSKIPDSPAKLQPVVELTKL